MFPIEQNRIDGVVKRLHPENLAVLKNVLADAGGYNIDIQNVVLVRRVLHFILQVEIEEIHQLHEHTHPRVLIAQLCEVNVAVPLSDGSHDIVSDKNTEFPVRVFGHARIEVRYTQLQSVGVTKKPARLQMLENLITASNDPRGFFFCLVKHLGVRYVVHRKPYLQSRCSSIVPVQCLTISVLQHHSQTLHLSRLEALHRHDGTSNLLFNPSYR
mmetsp:Transcript_19895/g.45823  ORF Transcript_19895/g.45823 Transcript_19895/m.45823 type:complete len:214 (-) Transcript_19895:588-1229(-)